MTNTTTTKKKTKYKVTITAHNKVVLEGEALDAFIRLYPKYQMRKIREWFGFSQMTALRIGNELGLQRDYKAIRCKSIATTKRTWRENGYYDDVKNRRPSDACFEAARRKMESGFYPMRQLKEQNPRKFKRTIKKIADTTRKLREKDRLRVKWGLKPKTNLRLFRTLTHAGYSQKCSMINANNYFSCQEHTTYLCYDRDTQRSERREKTAIRHGLKVVNAESINITRPCTTKKTSNACH